MADHNLPELIEKALSNNELFEQFPEYPPIAKSKEMLIEIMNNSADRNYLIEHKRKLNVGLLAAKPLDFEDDQRIIDYGNQLHSVWAALLSYLGKPRAIPTSGPELLALNFYKKHFKKPNPYIFDHMDGIDFGKPAKVTKLDKSKDVAQWRHPSLPQGWYYTENNASCKHQGA